MKIILTCLFFLLTPSLIASPLFIEAGVGITPSSYLFSDDEKSYLQIENEVFLNWDFTSKWSASGGIAYSQAADTIQSVTTQAQSGSTYFALSFHENNYRLSSSIQIGQDKYLQDNPTAEIDIPKTQDKNEHFQIDINYHHFFSLENYFISLGSGLILHQGSSQSVEDYEQLTAIYNAHYIDHWKSNRLLFDLQLSSALSRLFIVNNQFTVIPSLSWQYTLGLFERNQSLFESQIQNESNPLDSEYTLENDLGSQQNYVTARIQFNWRSLSMNLSSSVDIEESDKYPVSLRCYWQHQF
jgi:hypothetical protein